MKKDSGSKASWLVLCFTLAIFLLLLALALHYLVGMSWPASNSTVAEVEMSRIPPEEAPPGIAPDGGSLFTGQLAANVPDAHVLYFSHHQDLALYLGDELLFETPNVTGDSINPGCSLYNTALGENYAGKTFYIVASSPFPQYSDMLRNIYIGSEEALERFALSSSIPYLYIMVVCVLGGLAFMAFTFFAGGYARFQWATFFLGTFSALWGIYCICKVYIIYQFFSPLLISNLGLVIHILYALPIMLFFYFRFQYCKKWALPAIIIMAVALVATFTLRIFGVEFLTVMPYLTPLNQALFMYTVALALVDAWKGNRFIRVILPFSLPLLFSWGLMAIQYYTYRFSAYSVDLIYNVSFFVLLVSIWSYNTRELVQLWRRHRYELQELRLRNRVIMKTYQAILQKNEGIRMLKHEMNHQLAALQVLMQGGNLPAAQEFLASLVSWQGLQNQTYCDNPLINAIITDTATRAHQAGVDFTWVLNVPEMLNMDANELCSILMNIMDNALEACSLVPQPARYINLSIHAEPMYLFVECENAAVQKATARGDGYVTTKECKESHGFGLRIIRRMVEESGGLMNVESSESDYAIQLALQLGKP